jgi:hypothetical protein
MTHNKNVRSGEFPRTKIEDLSVSRLMIGINWFLGFSHTSRAMDNFIVRYQNRERLAETISVFMEAGVDTLYGIRPDTPVPLIDAVADAEQKTGRKCITLCIPHFDVSGTQEAADGNRRTVETYAELGCSVCLPHQASTDALVDRRKRNIDGIRPILKMIREAGMIPGLSTHMPETIPYADESDLDIGTYIQIYNAAHFLMQVEVDWVHRIIWNAKKPVITIKPLAAGRLHPLVGLAFNWATLREQDMVCIGCMSADEARECIAISRNQLSGAGPAVQLQSSRSKKSLS